MSKERQETAQIGGFDFNAVFQLIKSHWIWFAMSVCVFTTIGAIYAYTRQPKYTRTTQILIKDNDTGGKADISDFVGLDILSQNSNIYNELAIIQSPDLMEVVVRKLDLNKYYTLVKPLANQVLYGKTLPITIDADSLTSFPIFTLTCKIDTPESFTLSSFKANKHKYSEKVTGKFGVPVQTPVGILTVNKTEFFNPESLPLKIKFRMTDTYTAALSYQEQIKSRVPNQKTSIIELTYIDPSIQRADDILNSIIEAYNKNWLDDRNEVAVNTARFINARLHEIEGQLSTVDTDISSFKSSNLLPDLSQSSNQYMLQASKAQDALLELNNALYMAHYISDYIGRLGNDETIPVNTGFESQALAQQIGNYNQKVIERNNLASVSSASNPAVVDMDRALANMRGSVKASVDAEIKGLEQQIASQEKSQSMAISKISSNPKQAKYLLSVERQQKVIESLYLYLLQKREENDFSNTFVANNARIIKSPNGERQPSRPRKKLILLASLLVGFGLPFIFFYVRDKLNTTVRSRKDLDKIAAPILGEIPAIGGRKSRKLLQRIKTLGRRQVSEEQPRLVVVKDSRNVVNEAFRILRTNINMVIGKDTDRNVIAVTSFNAGSGKSFISANLGEAFALKDRRVLIIDCDLRHGSSSVFVGSPRHGLVDYLTGLSDDYNKLICKVDGNSELFVLPVGVIPPNPTELLENGRLEEIVEILRKEYDLIILDCPPLGIVADAQIIQQCADRTLFIVRAGLFQISSVQELNQLYRSGTLKNVGLVLNDVVEDFSSDYRKSRYYQYTKY